MGAYAARERVTRINRNDEAAGARGTAPQKRSRFGRRRVTSKFRPPLSATSRQSTQHTRTHITTNISLFPETFLSSVNFTIYNNNYRRYYYNRYNASVLNDGVRLGKSLHRRNLGLEARWLNGNFNNLFLFLFLVKISYKIYARKKIVFLRRVYYYD